MAPKTAQVAISAKERRITDPTETARLPLLPGY